jgi:hypothetical protein
MQQFRQGDVLIVAVQSLPQNSVRVQRENGQVILAHGEATGHAHAIRERGCDLFNHQGQTYLNVMTDNCVLRHEEHAQIPLPVGAYRIVRQREYTPKAVRYVLD